MDPIRDKVEAAKATRPVHVFEVPNPDGVINVGLVELTAEEELMATKRSRGDQFRLAYELAKQALVEVNGDRVNLADGSADRLWDQMGPRLRNMVLTAYADMHAPPEAAVAAFLKSRTIRVG